MQPVRVLRGAVGRLDVRLAVDLADREHECGTGLWCRTGEPPLRKPAIDDVAGLRRREERKRARLKSLVEGFRRP